MQERGPEAPREEVFIGGGLMTDYHAIVSVRGRAVIQAPSKPGQPLIIFDREIPGTEVLVGPINRAINRRERRKR